MDGAMVYTFVPPQPPPKKNLHVEILTPGGDGVNG